MDSAVVYGVLINILGFSSYIEEILRNERVVLFNAERVLFLNVSF